MSTVEINLDELISNDINSISGRHTGQMYAQKKNILNEVDKKMYRIVISSKIKAINDSFIKGFFSEIFKKYRTKDKVKEKFIIEADPYFVELFNKNFSILESISNS